jgi:hypothetical protein
MKMQTVAVKSSTLATVAYDVDRHLLELEFRNGTNYRYSGIPVEVYQALLRAPSKGQFFNREIRGKFPYALGPASPRRRRHELSSLS